MPLLNFSPSIAPSFTSLAERRKRGKQPPNFYVQCVGNLDDIYGGNISFSPFDSAVISPVNTSQSSERFLGQLRFLSEAADLLAKQGKFSVFHARQNIVTRTFHPRPMRSSWDFLPDHPNQAASTHTFGLASISNLFRTFCLVSFKWRPLRGFAHKYSPISLAKSGFVMQCDSRNERF
jgi:hypothetical protein